MPGQPSAARVRLVGAHAPVARGLARGALAYAAQVGAEAIQVFVTNPRGWAAPPGDGAQDTELREHVERTGLPVFVHAPYLINLGSPDDVVRERSASALGHCLQRAAEIAARGVVVHAGSAITADRAAGLSRMRAALMPLLDKLPDDGPDLLIEPMAGQGSMLCSTIGDIAPYLTALDWHPRALLCLDTCHLHAAGHDLTVPGNAAAVVEELARAASGRLRLIHANDSKDGCGSQRDRHESIGKGTIGAGPFRELLHHPATEGVAFVVETPGGAPGHARDVRTLRRLRARKTSGSPGSRTRAG